VSAQGTSGNRAIIVGFYNSQDGKRHGFVLSKGKFIPIDIPAQSQRGK